MSCILSFYIAAVTMLLRTDKILLSLISLSRKCKDLVSSWNLWYPSCKSKQGFSFLQMLIHSTKMGNLEMINLLCENSSKHIAASFPDGEISIHQPFHQPLRFTWMRLCVCSLCCFPARAGTPPSLLWLLKEVLTCNQLYPTCELIDCHLMSCFTCDIMHVVNDGSTN